MEATEFQSMALKGPTGHKPEMSTALPFLSCQQQLASLSLGGGVGPCGTGNWLFELKVESSCASAAICALEGIGIETDFGFRERGAGGGARPPFAYSMALRLSDSKQLRPECEASQEQLVQEQTSGADKS